MQAQSVMKGPQGYTTPWEQREGSDQLCLGRGKNIKGPGILAPHHLSNEGMFEKDGFWS